MAVIRLVVEEGNRTVRLPLAEGEHLLGSAPEADLRLANPSVSRRHARIVVDREGVRVQDLGSRNGTRVDGASAASEVRAGIGAELLFGTVAARLEEVADGELEAAVDLRGVAAPRDAAFAGAAPTASLGSIRSFALDRIPRLLDLLEDRAEPERLAREAAAAIAAELPCRHVEVGRPGSRGDALLFSAGDGVLDPRSTVTAPAGALELRVAFVHEAHREAFAPLVAIAARLVELSRPALAAQRPATLAAALPEPGTVDARLRKIYDDAARIARGEISVLVLGESGTGKEVFARYLHTASPRAAGPFVALNCAALPRDLLEAELFGIDRGVATGVQPRPGKFELADGGTLFLDEIGDMSPETQAKILRVLQEREVFRLGSGTPRSANVRVVAATNRDLAAMLADGRFRLDLYHRIADWRVELPPLRDRPGDVPNLAAHFLALEGRRLGIAIGGISRAAMAALQQAPWPGNVRQLEREMARAALFLADGDLLESGHLSAEVTSRASGRGLRERLEAFERSEIERALGAHGGDVAGAAERLGVGRSTLYRRMQELGVTRS